MKIVFYITNHGFGHASRNVPLIGALVKRSTENQIWVKSDKIRCDFIRRNLPAYDTQINYCSDCNENGILLKEGTMEVDLERTEQKIREDLKQWDAYVNRECAFLGEVHPEIVVSDVIPWGIKAAKQCGIPALLIGSFTWAEMYREFFPDTIWQPYMKCYQMADRALWYDIHAEVLHQICAKHQEVSLVSRPVHEENVQKIKASHKREIVFVSVGGSAEIHSSIEVGYLPYDFLITQGVNLCGENVTRLPADTINTPDIIAASDYVIAKGGWSTVAEILLQQKKCALLFRGNNSEDRNTKKILQERGHCVPIEEQDLRHIDRVIEAIDALEPSTYDIYRDDTNKICDMIEKG